MTDKNDDGPTLYCSFCGRSQHQTNKLIAGPEVNICDRCIFLCVDIILDQPDELFNNRHAAAKFITHMKMIEDKSPDAFHETCGYIKGVLHSLRCLEERPNTSQDNI